MKRLLPIALLLPLGAQAADYVLVIKNHQFQPTEITVPADTKIQLKIENQDDTPEEFDSFALNREKLIAGNSSALLFIGPLATGRYTFTGEFHAATAQGAIVAQ